MKRREERFPKRFILSPRTEPAACDEWKRIGADPRVPEIKFAPAEKEFGGGETVKTEPLRRSPSCSRGASAEWGYSAEIGSTMLIFMCWILRCEP